eukprot:6194511-Pleurochrysis_carterae.AAC.1
MLILFDEVHFSDRLGETRECDGSASRRSTDLQPATVRQHTSSAGGEHALDCWPSGGAVHS